MSNILTLERVETFISQYHILLGINFEAKAGEVSVLLERDGAGKTTTLRTIMGLTLASIGTIQLFPDLKKQGGNLSGGKMQMLAMARAFVNDSKLLLIDEPSKGLASIVIEKVIEDITKMKKHTSIVLVEQNFMVASKIGDIFTLIDDGRTVQSGKMQGLIEGEQLKRKYLGIG
ncbi:ATP-binding cassette domain-containing protein [Solibacillus silvestris]|uniref:ATP-binding cassette domain-containing protein n=1 Tax=Solibacillus silvestris TaxID=76853 RepID=UPI003F7D0885